MSHLLLTKAVNTILRHQKIQLDKMFNFRSPTKWKCHLTTLIYSTSSNNLLWFIFEVYAKDFVLCLVSTRNHLNVL